VLVEREAQALADTGVVVDDEHYRSIVRPRFDVWAFKTSFLFDEKALSERLCRELFDIALGRVGIGDFRPARKGPFGRSVVKCWHNETKAKED